MDLLNTLLETCTTLAREVEALEQDKIAQALKITKLNQKVRRLEKKNKLKVFRLRRLKKRTIAKIDADEDVILEEVDAKKDVKVAEKDVAVQGRQEESQAQVYPIDLEHADKVLSMQDDKTEPAELKEVIKVVTTAKLMTKVVTTAATTITATPSAARRRKGVAIRDLEETTTPSTIVYFEPKSKDKGKGILVEEPKPLKKQAQIEQDKAYARELKAELNKNIKWNDVIEQFKRKEKEDNAVLRYQALKRKLQTEAHARKNMMHFNSFVGFLEKREKKLEEEASIAVKRKNESSEQQAVKKQKFNEEVEELKKHLQIIPNDEDDVYTKANPLAQKVPVVDYQIYIENNKPYYKVIRADGTHQLFLSFLSLLRNFDREDLEVLWQIVQERFASSKPKNFSDDFLLATLKAMFEKPNVEAHIWKNQRGIHGLAKVKIYRLLQSCRVHIITFTTTQMILLVERRYPLTRFTLDSMLNNVRLEVEEESEVSLEFFGVDAVEDFKEYTLRDYYCWSKTYYCWSRNKFWDKKRCKVFLGYKSFFTTNAKLVMVVMDEMVNILVLREEYDKVFNHLDNALFEIEEEVYVCQPPRFEDPDFPNRVCKVEKALYGLHQAPRAWYETLSTYLLDNRFQRGKINKTLFIKRYKGDILLVQVYVDDIIFGSTKKELCNAFERLMHEKFQMISIGELTFFVGLEVKQKKDGRFISQDKYVAEILNKFRFTEVKIASTPMETQKPLLKDEDGEEVDVHMYRSIIGSLMYLTSSRPNIMFAVCACARYQVNLKVSHLHAVKRNFSARNRQWLQIPQLKLNMWLFQVDVDKCFGFRINYLIMGEGSTMPTDPITYLLFYNHYNHNLKRHKNLGSLKKDTQVPQPSSPTDNVVDEAVHKELGESLVRIATTASSLGAEQDNGNITKTQSKATPNKRSSQGTDSGGGPRCQEAIGDTTAQTRFESVSKHSNDSLLARGNILRNDEDSKKLDELMELCTNLRNRVLDLEKIKTTQRNEIDSFKRRVKKLKKRNRSRTHKLKRLYKVGGEEVFVVGQNENVVKEVVNAAQVKEPMKPKKKDQIKLDEEAALKLQAEFDEEERLTRERVKKEQEANTALIETCDDIQAKIDVDH
nr:uncharacterized mitochondrial protein AtMg00810-like [Tanacetum cinerariifolium]